VQPRVGKTKNIQLGHKYRIDSAEMPGIEQATAPAECVKALTRAPRQRLRFIAAPCG
jgi:hypothetical protein